MFGVDIEGLLWDLVDILFEDVWLFFGKGYVGVLEVNMLVCWLVLCVKLEIEGYVVEYVLSFLFEVLEGLVCWYGNVIEDVDDYVFDLEIGIEVEGKWYNLLFVVV